MIAGDFLFKTAVLHAMQGLLSNPSSDSRFVGEPGYTKEVLLAKAAVRQAQAIMNEFDKLEEKEKKD